MKLSVTAFVLGLSSLAPSAYATAVPADVAPAGGSVSSSAAVVSDATAAAATQVHNSDAKFRALFGAWKRVDQVNSAGAIAIPSVRPVAIGNFTSGFGLRSDPFRGTAAMHAGLDIAAPTGTPVYATADGVIDFSGWQRGYGNLIKINHGKGIETRYGHLSRRLVKDHSRVVRGQLIGLMGSTGRSTGSHLHYEVRFDGRATNPLPFIQSADYVMAMRQREASAVAQGGPDQ
jgi:murein DD-endopeptidase MepM/ murein hydrolase activator NlpD